MLLKTFRPLRHQHVQSALTLTSLVLLLSFPSTVISLGLGSAQLHTAIGQPLKVDIPVLDASAQYGPEDIQVRQVRGELARDLGYALAAEAARYSISPKGTHGELLLEVSSLQPVADPYISLLVELAWPGGTLYRDYDLLLDLSPATPVSTNIVTATAAPVAQLPAPTVIAETRPTDSRATSLWRVMPGDTLSQIAQKIRPDEQIKLVAVVAKLQQLNPQAFVGGNIDQLAGGALLTLPTAEQFGTMPRWDNKPGQAMAPIPQARTSRQGAGLAKISRVKAPQAKAAPAIHRPSPLPEEQQFFTGNSPYRVKTGDTLSQIAQQLRADPRIPLPRVIRALYRLNPQAFSNNDIDRLRVGSLLHLPSTPTQTAQAQAEQTPPEQPAVAPQTAAEQQTLNTPAPQAPAVETTQAAASSPSNQPQVAAIKAQADELKAENQLIKAHIAQLQQQQRLSQLENLLHQQRQEIQTLRQQLQTQEKTQQPAPSTTPEPKPLAIATPVPADSAPKSAPLTRTTGEAENTATDYGLWLALLIAAGLLGAIAFWFTQRRGMAMSTSTSVTEPAPSDKASSQERVLGIELPDRTASANDDAQAAGNIQGLATDEAMESWLEDSNSNADSCEDENTVSEAMIYAAYGRFEHAQALLEKRLAQHPNSDKLIKALERVRQDASKQGAVKP